MGVQAGRPQAAKWLQMAADRGVASSQARLGMYFQGVGSPDWGQGEGLSLCRIPRR